MIHAGIVLVTLGGILWFFGLLVFVAENGRLPGTHRRWSVYQRGGGGKIEVGLTHRSRKVPTAAISPDSETFDDDLIAAVASAREKAIALNVQAKSVARTLP